MIKNIGCLSDVQIRSRLSAAGISPTAQRIAICRYVLCRADHPTADEIKKWVDKNFPIMSLATVYNTMDILVKAGLLKEVRLPSLESVVYDSNVEDHFHFIDEESGRILDIGPDGVKISEGLKKQFNITRVEVILRGKRRRQPK